MLHDFLIFVAPFIVIGAAIVVSFWAAPKDKSVSKK
ncbi:cytochrome bd oxidase small subunit CydS [Domibacillus robiginosus]